MSTNATYGYVQNSEMVCPPLLKKIGLSLTGFSCFSVVGRQQSIWEFLERHRNLKVEYEEDPNFHLQTKVPVVLHLKRSTLTLPGKGWFGLPAYEDGLLLEIRLAKTEDLAAETWSGAEEEEDRNEAGPVGIVASLASAVSWQDPSELNRDVMLALINSGTSLAEIHQILKRHTSGWHDYRGSYEVAALAAACKEM